MSLDPGVKVRSVDNPGRTGTISNLPMRERKSGRSYMVNWADGFSDYVLEDELEVIADGQSMDPFTLVEQGRYGRALDLRRNLTFVHLSGKLANFVYSMGITATDFYAHQYRPLLTLLDSPTNGLLIADEVGLGKTIEAGLIWTELRARYDLRRLVVVCPAMLREKWRDELRIRFGVDAHLADAQDLLRELSQPRQQFGEGRAWIISYHGGRPPREWRPDFRPVPSKPGPRWQLADFLDKHADDEPIVDMVVFDEAHYMRNTETGTRRLGELLGRVAGYQIMLSATPINLHNRDLFSLLNLLDPEHFESDHDFARLLDANKPLIAARDAALDTKARASRILGHLQRAAQHSMLKGSRQLAAVLARPPTDDLLQSKEYRASLAESLERLSLLSHVLTRTRKRDVQERRVKRNVKREAIPMTDAERRLYVAVSEATRKFAANRNISDGFLLAMPQRMVTSCPLAVARAWLNGGRSLDELGEDLAEEFEDDSEDGDDRSTPAASTLVEFLRAALPRALDLRVLERRDSKFERLMQVAGHHLEQHPGEKIVIFTSFRAVAKYLVERLNAERLPARYLMGGQGQTRQQVIDEFRKSTLDRVLVSTEVASEGVDLQFCRVLVNYDLPWNPTRIEQRIGRIDRIGQQAELIHVWNLFFADTIDERIIGRLLGRLKIFEEALGESEAVVGNEVRRLESALLSRRLTSKEVEQRIDQTAQAFETLRLQREELEKNAAHMMAHGQRVIERIEAAQELARRVTEEDLYVYVQDYLNRHWTGHRFNQKGSDRYTVHLQLPPELAARLDEYMRLEGLLGKTGLASGEMRLCRFLNRISEVGKKDEEIVHQFHPLIRYVGYDLKRRGEHFYPIVAVKVIGSADVRSVRAGRYVFCVRAWSFRGVRDEEQLATVVLDLESGEQLPEDVADRLVQLARLNGQDWTSAGPELDSGVVCRRIEMAEESLEERFRAELQRKRDENDDRAEFQLNSIEQHLERKLPSLREVLQVHLDQHRKGLAVMTQARIDKLTARMSARKERIREKQRIAADKNFVCAGLIDLY